MTGFSQPPDPDNDLVDAEKAVAQPMTPDEPSHPTEDDKDENSDTNADSGHTR